MDTADVSHAACTGAALGSLAWVCFQPRDEFLQILRRHVLPRNNHQRETGEQRDRLEIIQHVVLKIVQRTIGNMRVPEAQAERVAVRSGPRDPADRNAAVRSGHVFNDDGLAKRCLHPLGKTRPTVSPGPPAAYGTTMVIGRVG